MTDRTSANGKYTLTATLGMVLGKSLHFDSYEEASDLGHLMTVGQPIGIVVLTSPEGRVMWSYKRRLSDDDNG
jgi:NAD-dependent oxidoreductase involved in siderophore biosynthesis